MKKKSHEPKKKKVKKRNVNHQNEKQVITHHFV